MTKGLVIWHGTQTESFDLQEAIGHNCECQNGPMGDRVSTCEPHKALVYDQRWLNGLLYARRIVGRLRVEEWKE